MWPYTDIGMAVWDYNNVENLVKTMKRSNQPQKSKSRSDGDYSSSTDEENSNHQSSLPSPLHHQDEHKNVNHLGHHPASFRRQLTACHIGRSDRGVGSNTGQSVFPMRFMNTHGEQIQASIKFQGIHEDSPTHIITCQRSSKDRRIVHLLLNGADL